MTLPGSAQDVQSVYGGTGAVGAKDSCGVQCSGNLNPMIVVAVAGRPEDSIGAVISFVRASHRKISHRAMRCGRDLPLAPWAGYTVRPALASSSASW